MVVKAWLYNTSPLFGLVVLTVHDYQYFMVSHIHTYIIILYMETKLAIVCLVCM